MKHYIFLAAIPLFLVACGGNFKYPSTNPETMSDNTLCFRSVSNPGNEALADQVKLRKLDCAAMLENDPLFNNPGRTDSW